MVVVFLFFEVGSLARSYVCLGSSLWVVLLLSGLSWRVYHGLSWFILVPNPGHFGRFGALLRQAFRIGYLFLASERQILEGEGVPFLQLG